MHFENTGEHQIWRTSNLTISQSVILTCDDVTNLHHRQLLGHPEKSLNICSNVPSLLFEVYIVAMVIDVQIEGRIDVCCTEKDAKV